MCSVETSVACFAHACGSRAPSLPRRGVCEDLRASKSLSRAPRMSKNAVEATFGIRFTSSRIWDPHPTVGLSSFWFGVPSCAFLAVAFCLPRVVVTPWGWPTTLHYVSYLCLGVSYAVAIFTCGLADYAYIRRGHRSFYGKVDVIWAAVVFMASNIDFLCRAGFLETACLSSVAMASFIFSGCSTTWPQWVFRHSLWHALCVCVH